MVTTLGFADVVWLIFLYAIFYAALPNVQGSKENKHRLYRCNLDETVKKPSSVILNWKVDRENMEMTWDSNVTVAQCSVDTPRKTCDYGIIEQNSTMCYFDSVSLHEGATFIIKIKYLNQTLSDSVYFPPQETDGTSAENFSCVLYNDSSVNCTWNAGRNAPADVQYFLYLKYNTEYSGKDREQKRECPHYINNTLGRHIACHIPKMNFDSNNDAYYFYVNGSSKKSHIRYYDVLLKPCSHERLGPPQAITQNCSKLPSKCRIQWTPPLNNEYCCCIRYEIKDEIKNTTELITYNYKDIDVDERHILRIRSLKNQYVNSEWSEPIVLDPPSQPIPSSAIILIPVAVGTILIILILVFLCKRYRIWHKLTVPVPQPKDLFQQYSKNTEKEWMEPIPTACEPDEKITFIEEVTDGFKK
ncbi:PREDICTED: granulocyte-macrophage colony-stimulating factor receptor subunit alpha-like [Gekko japonicus]|uniref:Granulocyte-macrophage colony-stimulating factor receptor subunit alpha-like n=1 Tax=Gekko japonicus TaxID=146911 RepID=A0ABM1KXX0_GEKJA|nr:PREDICTED: granulocyte-macrophage colony-stimulating factor receptor subunit alpha-like [Gekko japonicus]